MQSSDGVNQVTEEHIRPNLKDYCEMPPCEPLKDDKFSSKMNPQLYTKVVRIFRCNVTSLTGFLRQFSRILPAQKRQNFRGCDTKSKLLL